MNSAIIKNVNFKNINEVIFVDMKNLCGPLELTFRDFNQVFIDKNIPSRVVNDLSKLHNNSVIFIGQPFDNSSESLQQLITYAPNAIYILWYWDDKDASGLRNVIHIYENILTPQAYGSGPRVQFIQNTMKYHCPFYLRAADSPDKIGTYPRNIRLDYFYSGSPYCDNLVPSSEFSGIYNGNYNFGEFLNYSDRRNLYLSSHFALGFQSDENIVHSHVSQRIYEGLAYGCIVLTNSTPAVIQTDGIAVKIENKHDLEEKMRWFLSHPDEMEAIRQRGYEFVKREGTNHFTFEKIWNVIEKME